MKVREPESYALYMGSESGNEVASWFIHEDATYTSSSWSVTLLSGLTQEPISHWISAFQTRLQKHNAGKLQRSPCCWTVDGHVHTPCKGHLHIA